MSGGLGTGAVPRVVKRAPSVCRGLFWVRAHYDFPGAVVAQWLVGKSLWLVHRPIVTPVASIRNANPSHMAVSRPAPRPIAGKLAMTNGIAAVPPMSSPSLVIPWRLTTYPKALFRHPSRFTCCAPVFDVISITALGSLGCSDLITALLVNAGVGPGEGRNSGLLKGTYRQVSVKHLYRYLAELMWRSGVAAVGADSSCDQSSPRRGPGARLGAGHGFGGAWLLTPVPAAGRAHQAPLL